MVEIFEVTERWGLTEGWCPDSTAKARINANFKTRPAKSAALDEMQRRFFSLEFYK
jgi:hypothetical protein